MEDLQIINLYFERSETAIAETAAKYGRFCRNIALNIISVAEDAEECVNDTYLQAWNSIPPQRPEKFRAWLGRVVRNITITARSGMPGWNSFWTSWRTVSRLPKPWNAKLRGRS